MTQEDKDLLIKDLCARLPYGVICQMEDDLIINDSPFYDCILSERYIGLFRNHKDFYIKPYLRPMSSMTEEEKETYYNLCYEEEREELEFGEWVTRVYYHDTIDSIDYLNSIHIDYRGLIPKGLAISTEIFNPYKD